MPDKTLTVKGDKCHGGKKSKERITVLVWANMDGSEKLPLLVIGKFAKPRCFKGVQSFPVTYRSNSKAWMNSALFEDWVQQLDRRFQREKRDVLLVIDNCPAHPKIDGLSAIRLVFLPPNTTSCLQPCDQGIINNLKCFYRKRLIIKLTEALDAGQDLQISLLDAIYMLSLAWRDVTEVTISNCFKKAGFASTRQTALEVSNEPINSIEMTHLWEGLSCAGYNMPNGIALEQFVHADDDVVASDSPTEHDIVETVRKQFGSSPNPSQSVEDEDIDDCGSKLVPPTPSEAKKALQVLRDFVSAKPSCTELFTSIADLEDEILRLIDTSRVQSHITDFFCSKS